MSVFALNTRSDNLFPSRSIEKAPSATLRNYNTPKKYEHEHIIDKNQLDKNQLDMNDIVNAISSIGKGVFTNSIQIPAHDISRGIFDRTSSKDINYAVGQTIGNLANTSTSLLNASSLIASALSTTVEIGAEMADTSMTIIKESGVHKKVSSFSTKIATKMVSHAVDTTDWGMTFFSSIGTNLKNKIRPPKTNLEKYKYKISIIEGCIAGLAKVKGDDEKVNKFIEMLNNIILELDKNETFDISDEDLKNFELQMKKAENKIQDFFRSKPTKLITMLINEIDDAIKENVPVDDEKEENALVAVDPENNSTLVEAAQANLEIQIAKNKNIEDSEVFKVAESLEKILVLFMEKNDRFIEYYEQTFNKKSSEIERISLGFIESINKMMEMNERNFEKMHKMMNESAERERSLSEKVIQGKDKLNNLMGKIIERQELELLKKDELVNKQQLELMEEKRKIKELEEKEKERKYNEEIRKLEKENEELRNKLEKEKQQKEPKEISCAKQEELVSSAKIQEEQVRNILTDIPEKNYHHNINFVLDKVMFLNNKYQKLEKENKIQLHSNLSELLKLHKEYISKLRKNKTVNTRIAKNMGRLILNEIRLYKLSYNKVLNFWKEINEHIFTLNKIEPKFITYDIMKQFENYADQGLNELNRLEDDRFVSVETLLFENNATNKKNIKYKPY